MDKQAGRVGGFVALNSGEITNCYSNIELNSNKKISGGLVGENNGEISHSFYSGAIKRLNGGLIGSGKGRLIASYFFTDEPKDSKKLDKLYDKKLARSVGVVRKAGSAEKLGFDTTNIWKYSKDSKVLDFIEDNWLYDVSQSPVWPQIRNKMLKIHTARELLSVAKKINSGDRELASAYIRLEDNIDLGGIEWEPIGNEPTTAFSGIFDGNDHCVSNFVIKSKRTKVKGFFGYLKGHVYNLGIDGVIKAHKGDVAGGIAGYCLEGVIGCCASAIEGKYGSGSLGGFVGLNTGKIFQSCSIGKVSSLLIPWFWFAPLLMLPLLLMLFISTPDKLPVFAPVPVDPDISPISGETANPRTGTNFVSFQFEREIDINLTTGECLFDFKNPGNSNHDLVVQLQLTDAQAKEIMGSTGRTDKEQKKLDDNPNYNPENHRIVIAESGAIPPGYQLENLRLTGQPNGATIPPGNYKATVYLNFYDIDTHSKAMLESQLPVTINVHS